MLDKDVLDRLREDVGSEPASFLIDSLKTEIASGAEALEEFFQKNDLKQLEIQAHALKSAARSFGAMQLGEVCFTIEMGVKKGITRAELGTYLADFKTICKETLEAYNAL